MLLAVRKDFELVLVMDSKLVRPDLMLDLLLEILLDPLLLDELYKMVSVLVLMSLEMTLLVLMSLD